MRLIDKDKIVAEIKKRLHANGAFDEVGDEAWAEDVGMCKAYKSILSYIDTLEVKEVDLEKETEKYVQTKEFIESAESPVILVAKHFFELGLKVNLTKNAISTFERKVKIDAGGYPYTDCNIEFYDYDKDIPLAKEGDKVKVIVVKEE